MAVYHVAQIGHPILRRVADPVPPELIQTPEFQTFCEDMLDTLEEYDGLGLAAPQVHHSIRVVIATLDDEKGPEFFINPQISPLTDETERHYEGCLSIEGMRAAVDRPRKVRVVALDRDGSFKGYELEGFPATVIQHECDHLDGILFIDRCDTRTLAFVREYRRFGPLDRWDDEDPDDLSEELSEDDDPATQLPDDATEEVTLPQPEVN